MLFNSFEFLLFLPIVFLLYWFVFCRSLRLQNIFIVVVSYIFYGWWDWKFLLLIAFTSMCSYVSGVFIERYNDQRKIQRWINIVNITLNITILGIFKYYNFFISSFAETFGCNAESLLLNIILPVGISFYTFQALSYSIDVYRGVLKPTHNIINLFAYVSFFPQLVAGPIERATNLLPQFEQRRVFDYDTAVDGCRQILWGFFKKIIIADMCAEGANAIFSGYETAGSVILVVGAILFSLQIYGDFSAYSDIAIGCSKLFGIRLMRNFNIPYFSRDIAEFWRKWHISLTTWFRDYLYIPLGGSRGSRGMVIRNTFIIFLVSGLWHGANWTFIAWGAYHALLFVPLLLTNSNRKNQHVIALDRKLPTLMELGQILATFILVTIGWVIFRADTISMAADYFIHMATAQPFYSGVEIRDYLPMTNIRFLAYSLPLMIFVEWISRNRSHSFDFDMTTILRFKSLRWTIYIVMICYITYAISTRLNATTQEFIYFQF